MPDPLTSLMLHNIQPTKGHGGWHGGPTPVRAVRGLSAKDAAWRPAPGRKSIWDLVLHIAYWNYAVRGRLEGKRDGRFPRSPANWPRTPVVPDEAAWKADVDLLKAEHERLLSTVAAIPSSRYDEPTAAKKRWTIGDTIVGIALHDAYHAGQIQMLKRLMAAMPAQRRRARKVRRPV